MHTTETAGNRAEEERKLKQKFIVFSNNNLMIEEGKQEGMYGNLQAKLDKTNKELHKIIAAL